MRYIMSIDLGTTGNRVFLFSDEGIAIASSYREFTQFFPRPGWVEHDALEIWNSVIVLINDVLKKSGIDGKQIVTIGITNQRETSLLWNRSGEPVHRAIVWQCRRTSSICDTLKRNGYEDLIRRKCGLVIDPYFSATKVQWLFENVEGLSAMADSGNLFFGTIDTWILWRLSAGKSHRTDCTNASRTLLYNIHSHQWDPELCNLFHVPISILPEVQESASHFGQTLGVPGLPDGIPIGGIAGDQQAASVGQGCVFQGTTKNTYGTGCFILQNTGKNAVLSDNGLLTTIACDDMGHPSYALEGSVFIGGAAVQWMRDSMKFFSESSQSEVFARDAKENEVVMVPAFTGLGAPWWNNSVRGAIFGITRDTTLNEIVQAGLKSIALQSGDALRAMESDSGCAIHELRVDGGATANSYLMQFQSDILGIPVILPQNTESTALGAAYLAGINANIFSSVSEIACTNPPHKRFVPLMSQQRRDRELFLWNKSLRTLLSGEKQIQE